MNRMKLIREQMLVTQRLVNFMLLKNQKPMKYGNSDLIYSAEADIISIIGKSGNICASDIAKVLNVSKSAVSKTIRKLIHKEIVCCTVSSSDSRKNLLSLTQKGVTIFQYHKKIDMNTFLRILNRLSQCTDEEIRAYIKIAKIQEKERYRLIEEDDGPSKKEQSNRTKVKKEARKIP